MADLFVHERPGPPGAPRVVLVHGSLDRSSAFLRAMRHLDGLTVVRYDRRGYAKSLAVPPSDDFHDQVADLASVVGDRPSVVAGHSLGGVIALAFAHHHPELTTAVVSYESPMPWLDSWPTVTAGGAAMAGDGDPADAAERFMRRMVGDDRWDRLPEATKVQRRAEGPALVAELRSIRPPHPGPYDPARLVMPVVVAHGTASRPHHQAGTRALAAALPHGELVVIEGAQHGVHLSDPVAFAGLVHRALERAAAG